MQLKKKTDNKEKKKKNDDSSNNNNNYRITLKYSTLFKLNQERSN